MVANQDNTEQAGGAPASAEAKPADAPAPAAAEAKPTDAPAKATEKSGGFNRGGGDRRGGGPGNQRGGGPRRDGRGGPRRDEKPDDGLEEKVVFINRCAKVSQQHREQV